MSALPNKLRLLVTEDNPGDYVLIQEYLHEKVQSVQITHVSTLKEAEQNLQENTFDAILLDLSLPDASGEEVVQRIVGLADKEPVIVLTGFENEEFGLHTLSIGASDYLLKDELNSFVLYKSISYSIERSRINRSLKESEKKYRDIFNLSPQPMWVYDLGTLEFLDVNQAAIDHYGYSRREYLEMTLEDIRPKEEIPDLLEAVELSRGKDQLSYEGVFQHRTKSGKLLDVKIKSNIIEYEGRKAEMVLAEDITEKLKAERALNRSEQRFRSLIQEGSDLIAILDEEAHYKYVAPSSIPTLGISPEEFIGNNALDYIHEEDKDRIIDILGSLSSKERVKTKPFRFKNANGEWRWIETTITNMLDNPAVEGFVANSSDVTERINRQKELQESVNRYETVAKATSDTIWDLNLSDDSIRYNKNIYSMFGYNRQQVKEIRSWWQDKIHPDDRPIVIKQINEALDSGQGRFQLEYRFQCANGTYKDIYDRAFIVTDDEENPIRVIGAMQNVTDQKEEKRWLKLFESAISTTNESVAIIEAEPNALPGREILYVNEAFTKMTGYKREEAVGNTLHILNGANTSQKKRNKLRKSMAQWESCEAEFINYTKGGEEFWINVSYAPVKGADGGYSHWVCVGRNVTDRRQRERDLEESLAEKQILLLEIHHRVKNNLAIVSGMMQLQAFSEGDERVRQKLMDSVSRIHTMGSIHELLYQSNSFSKLNLDKNILKLVSTITDTIQTEIGVDIQYNLSPISLNINQALPCSLIVNEVVTNALKHAFKGKNSGKLWIDVSKNNGQINLKVKDNGHGLPSDFENLPINDSLGLKLIDTLVKQLKGEYIYKTHGTGTLFSLTFEKANVKGIGNVHL